MEFYKFDLRYDRDLLQNDLKKCQQKPWPLHFNKKDYSGTWSSFALRSISGSETDILATPNATFKDTPTLAECAYFKQIIDSFQCQKEAVRLLSLSPESSVEEHRDPASGYQDGFFRIHIPIQTNAEVTFRLNGKVLPMKAGECWYADFNLPHYISNQGKNDRIHLIIDCLRNSWSDALFEKAGYNFAEENIVRLDNDTRHKMIEQLLLMNTAAAQGIIAQLKAEMEA